MKNLTKKINDFLLKFQSVPLSQKIFFVQNLEVMIKAGLSLSQALSALAEQTTHPKLKKIVTETNQQIKQGNPLSKSLSNYPGTFSQVFISMIRAGEASGNLQKILHQLTIRMKKDYELISKVKSALTYPIVVLIAMMGMGIAMIIFVVPKITSIFEQMEATLPLPTKILIGISKFVTNNGLLTSLGVIIIIAAFITFIRNRKGKYYWHKFLLKLPLISPIIKKINLARFSRTLTSLITTDIPIVQSFEITSQVVGNLIYQEKLSETGKKLKKGMAIHKILVQYPSMFPPVVTQMIQVGEQSGNLDELLEELAAFYENDVHETMGNLSSIIEPILILILGGAVGAMAVAIIMPMYSLTEQF